jgi:hypothetical protein
MKILQLIAYILILAVLMPLQLAQARTYQEIVAEIQAGRNNIDAALRAINADADKVIKATAAIRNAEHFEGPHWITLEQAVQQWVATTGQQAGVIDRNARNILRLDPATDIRLEALTNPGLEFRALRNHLVQIRTNLESSVTRAQQARQRQAELRKRVRGEMREGTYSFPVEVIADLIGVPTRVEDVDRSIVESAAVGVIKVACLVKGWFVTPIIIAVADPAIKLVVKSYYYADEMKSGARVLRSTEEVLAFADEFISRVQADIRSVQQGIDLIDRWWLQAGDTLANFSRAQNGWRAMIREAANERAEQELRRVDEAQVKPESGIFLFPDLWPNVPMQNMPASEFAPEANAILRELRSAAEAAVQGGSPMIFFELVNSHRQRLADRRAKADEQVRQAQAVREQALNDYRRAVQAAMERRHAANAACLHTWHPDPVGCIIAANNAYNSAVQAAQIPLHAPTNALAAAMREARRLQHIDEFLVRSGASDLLTIISRAAKDRRNEYFNALWPKHRSEFSLAAQNAADGLAAIPSLWWLPRNFTPSAADIEGSIRSAIEEWGSSPAEQRDTWLEKARRIRTTGEAARAAIPEYRKALEAMRNAAKAAETELLAFVERYGPLMSYQGPLDPWMARRQLYHGHVYYTQANVDAYIRSRKHEIRQVFSAFPAEHGVVPKSLSLGERAFFIQEARHVAVAEHVALAERFDYEGTAQRIEEGLAQVQVDLDHWTQQWNIFYLQLSNLQPQMKQFSQAIARLRTQVTPERAQIDKLLAMIPDDSRLHAAYQALPDFLKRSQRVHTSYQRHKQEMNRLRGSLYYERAEEERRRAAEKEWLAAIERRRAEEDRARAVETRLQSVRQLYQDFAAAYEARNLGRIVRLMAPDWQADDGSDLRDLEDNLSNSFRVFDRIGFRVDNLNIHPLDDRHFQVNYQLTINGQIFQMNLKHEEKSSVQDLVVVEPDGSVRIRSTSGGRLWMQ